MKKLMIAPMIAVMALGLAACSKPAETTNVTDIESNTIIEDTDANFSAVDGVATDNSADLENSVELNATGNAL